MLCADFLNTLYKLEINRTFIEHEKKYAIKKLKKYTNINMKKMVIPRKHQRIGNRVGRKRIRNTGHKNKKKSNSYSWS